MKPLTLTNQEIMFSFSYSGSNGDTFIWKTATFMLKPVKRYYLVCTATNRFGRQHTVIYGKRICWFIKGRAILYWWNLNMQAVTSFQMHTNSYKDYYYRCYWKNLLAYLCRNGSASGEYQL